MVQIYERLHQLSVDIFRISMVQIYLRPYILSEDILSISRVYVWFKYMLDFTNYLLYVDILRISMVQIYLRPYLLSVDFISTSVVDKTNRGHWLKDNSGQILSLGLYFLYFRLTQLNFVNTILLSSFNCHSFVRSFVR